MTRSLAQSISVDRLNFNVDRSICILCRRVDVQKLSYVFAMYVCVMYMSCSVCAKTLLSFCVYEQRLCHVFAMYVIAMHVNRSDKAKNRLIYCIMQTCRCAKAESCLCNVCMWCIWVAAYAQRRCCRSVYMSKDCDMSLQCMWLQCM